MTGRARGRAPRWHAAAGCSRPATSFGDASSNAVRSYPSRAAALPAAVDELLAETERRAIDRAIVEGYERMPPTAEEDAHACASTICSVAAEPW